MLEKFTKFLIFCFLFFPDFKVFNIAFPIILFTIMFSVILIYNKTKIIKSIFRKDKIKLLLFWILILSITTYFLNAGNAETVTQINYYNTGLKPDNLYLKLAANGVILIITGLLGLSIGLSYNGIEHVIRRVITFIVNLITINAFFTIIAWVVQTGGVIGRYNFDLPIISSFGINIQWSILGLILHISLMKTFKRISLDTGKLFILFFSILIIISRENQLLCVVILTLYLYLSSKKKSKGIIIIYFIILSLSLFYYAQSIFNETFRDTYLAMLNPQGDDFLVRYDSIVAGLQIFKQYIMFGIGYGMFAGYNSVAVSITGVNFYLGSLHNGIVSILAEMGLVGLFLNVFLIANIIRRLNSVRKNTQRLNDKKKKYVIAIYVFIVTNLFALLISNYILLPPPSEYSYYGIAFISWLLIGLLLSFEKNGEISR